MIKIGQPAFTCSKSTMETPEHVWNCSKLTVKTPEQCQWRHSGAFIVSFEQILHHSGVSLVNFEQGNACRVVIKTCFFLSSDLGQNNLYMNHIKVLEELFCKNIFVG